MIGGIFPGPPRASSCTRFAKNCGRRTFTTPRSRRWRPQRRRRPAARPTCVPATGPTTTSACPRMGSAGIRFGRNVPLNEAFPDTANLMNPSPRRVSLELLTRDTFQPATILNVIAAAWIQFMVHDWFVHKKGTWSHTHDIPVDDGDSWHERPMRVPKTPADRAQGRQLEAAAGVHQREHALVGRLARLRQQRLRRRRRCAPAARARCWSARAAGSASTRSRAGRSPASPRTAGWA